MLIPALRNATIAGARWLQERDISPRRWGELSYETDADCLALCSLSAH